MRNRLIRPERQAAALLDNLRLISRHYDRWFLTVYTDPEDVGAVTRNIAYDGTYYCFSDDGEKIASRMKDAVAKILTAGFVVAKDSLHYALPCNGQLIFKKQMMHWDFEEFLSNINIAQLYHPDATIIRRTPDRFDVEFTPASGLENLEYCSSDELYIYIQKYYIRREIMFKKPKNIPVVTENKSVFDTAVRTRLYQKNKAFGDMYDRLCAIHDDNSKCIKIAGWPDIIFDGENFRISTGAFIGRRPEDCVDISSYFPQYIIYGSPAPEIADIDDRTLLITTGTTRDDVITFFAKRVTWGTLYLKNPDATILLLKEGGMNVYFDKGCDHKNLKSAMISDLCKELGLWEV